MTDAASESSEPAADDLVIWKLRAAGSQVISQWQPGTGVEFSPKYSYAEGEARLAATEAVTHAERHRVDVWIREADKPPYRWKSFRQTEPA